MDDRRKEIRKKLMTFTVVHDGHGRLLGYLANLTMQGAMVMSENPLAVQVPVTLVIDFPNELPGGLARRLDIAARVARCVPDVENPHEFNLGFEFTEVTPAQAQIITALLDRYHFRHRSWAKEEE